VANDWRHLAFLRTDARSPQGAQGLPSALPGAAQATPGAALAHVCNGFEFTVDAPYAKVAPLFGADAERAWAGDTWSPHFVFPESAPFDVPGAVFTIERGGQHETWMCTNFDLERGRVQYAYTIGGALAALIDIRLSAPDSNITYVQVVYERNALVPEANDHVREMGEADRNFGKEWQQAIDRYLKTTPGA
jgi:hypothetical protein